MLHPAENILFYDFDVPLTNRLTALFTGSAFALNPLIVGIAQNMCKAANAKLVCSSNRATPDKKDETIGLLTQAGFNCYLYLHDDWTCNYESTVVKPPNKDLSALIRTNNIERWISEHPEIKGYVAFDDLKLSLKNFVHITDTNNGILYEDLDKACHLLGISLMDVVKAANPKAPHIKFPPYTPL